MVLKTYLSTHKLFHPPRRTITFFLIFMLASVLRSDSTNNARFHRCGRINTCYTTVVVIVPQFSKQFKVGMRDLCNGETS